MHHVQYARRVGERCRDPLTLLFVTSSLPPSLLLFSTVAKSHVLHGTELLKADSDDSTTG